MALVFDAGAGSGSSCGGDQTAAASLFLSLGSGGITLAFPCCLLKVYDTRREAVKSDVR